MQTMNPLAKLDHLDLNPAAKTQVAAMIQALLDQAKRDAKTIQAKDFKIKALTHELAHIRRIRYGVKSETLSPIQRDVFEETWNTDLSAIEAEVEQLQDDQPGETVVKPKRPRAGRQPLPDHLPRIEPCPELAEGSAKMLPNSWMSSLPSFSSTAIFALSMLAGPAKP